MMSNSNHTLGGFLPLGVSRKRKESESGPKPVFKKASKSSFISKPVPLKATAKQGQELKPPACDNRVLAGFMANEFLSKGKLFGRKYDQARAEAAPVSAKKPRARARARARARGDHTNKVGNEVPKQIQSNNGKQEEEQQQSYAEVANLLKRDGTHIPGIVNPTQLARWLQQQQQAE